MVSTPPAMIRARMARRSDAATAAPLLAAGCLPPDAPAALTSLLEGLIGGPLLRCGLIEEFDARNGWTLSAIGATGFVTETMVTETLADPAVYCTARLLARHGQSPSAVFLDEGAVAAANAGAGLNLFVLGFNHRYADGAAPTLRPMLAHAIGHFVHAHRGFNLRQILREDIEPIAEVLVASGMRTIRHHPAEGGGPGRTLLHRMADTERPLFPDSITAQLFAFVPPVILFSAAERRLLEAAVEGLADEDIAAQAGISMNTVKRTWRAVYDRALARAPQALGEGAATPSDFGVRGSEKRRHLLAYLREHPQELRPYAANRPF